MRAVRLTLLSMALAFSAGFLTEAAAQSTGTVTGQVTDASTGAPLTGVQVQVVGTNIGGLTDQNGRYLINRVPAGTQQIRAVLIGYSQETRSVTLAGGGTATADFALETSAVALEAVVVSAVTGREQRARELGSNVSAIEVEDLNPAPITSFADALGGRSSGVIMQDVNGTTGTSQRIRIRGANSLSLSNEPLIYIDGVQANNSMSLGDFGVGGASPSRLNDLNPNDISNIEIVKGPAASALYGTAAANGVILITTKRGTPGSTQWTAFVETGSIEDVTDYPANFLTLDHFDTAEPALLDDGTPNWDAVTECPNWAAALAETSPYYPFYGCEQDLTLSFNTLKDPRTTPFVTGDRQRYGASVRGGTEQVRFFISGQIEDEMGVIAINTQEKVNLRANLDAELSETTDLSVSFGYADNALTLNNNDNSIFSPLINGLIGTAYFVPADEDTPDQVNQGNYGFGFNMTDLGYLVHTQEVDRYTTSANLRFRPATWLTLNGTGGLDLTSMHGFETLQPNRLPIAASYTNGYRQSQRTNDYLYTLQGSATGTFDIASDLLSTSTAGVSYTRDNSQATLCYGSYITPGANSCDAATRLFSIDEDFFEVRTLGVYGQQELAWRDRIFLAAALRADDNSAFGEESELAYYPSASLSWVVAEEPWFPQFDFLSTLRLRGAWGVSGLRPGFRSAQTLYSFSAVASESGNNPGITLSNLGNRTLNPERSTEVEFGFDTGLFDDRLSLEFTYFNKKSRDALVSRRLPGSLGLTTTIWENLGEIRNSGTEAGANLRVFESKNFGLNLGVTNTTLENEIVELGEDIPPIIFNRGVQRHQEGYPAGGFFQQPYTFDDANDDGLLSPDEVTLVECDATADPDCEDNVFIGPSLPKWQRTLFADIRLFDWLTVSTLFEGRGGHYSVNYTERWKCNALFFSGCAALGDPEASLEEQARFIATSWLPGGTQFGFIEPADFYKWREMSVTLGVPTRWAQNVSQLQGLRLTFAGRNLATWTDFSGFDPETVEGGGGANFSQGEFNTQPPVRYLMLRLDYTF